MYLEKFIIKNFRGIKDISLVFNKGLNVLIGENNTGKTAIIDALRVCLSYGNQKREIYVSKSDFCHDKSLVSNCADHIEY
jgi:putative ATP-dependent endonuclease of the OLD family